MISEEQFSILLESMESETLDFKESGYDLQIEHSKFSMVKDIICMANTPRETSSYIIIGVKKHTNGRYELIGTENHPDEAAIQQQFTDRVYPIPDFTYYPFPYQGKQFGVFEIRPIKKGPCEPTRDFSDKLRRWTIYFRRGSRNDIATPEDRLRIQSWFGEKEISRISYDEGGTSWETLLRETNDFDPSRYFILILLRQIILLFKVFYIMLAPCPRRLSFQI